MAAVLALGAVGYGVAMIFLSFGAPDLAMTQFSVETLTVLIYVLVFRHFRGLGALSPLSVRLRDGLIAGASGLFIGGLLLSVAIMATAPSLREYFAEFGPTLGHGRNIVNVILVDFRGFDTLGEITVLAIVALTVYALMRRFRPAPDSLEVPEQRRARRESDGEPGAGQPSDALAHAFLVPALIMRLLFPVIGTTAVYLFMRGHDLPGGGFVAGLTMSVAFILQYMAGGTRWVEDRLTILPVIWMGLGLAFALAIGVGAWLFGSPFLTSAFTYADLPVIGRVPLASALIFDLGVFTLVVGATVLILIALAHQSIRSHRAAKTEAVTLEEARVA